MIDLFAREHAQAQARGDTQLATEAGVAIEDRRREQLQAADDLSADEKRELRQLDESAKIRELVDENDVDVSEIRPTGANDEGGPQLTVADVESAIGKSDGDSGDDSDSPKFSSESAEEAYNDLSDDEKADVEPSGKDGAITVADVRAVS